MEKTAIIIGRKQPGYGTKPGTSMILILLAGAISMLWLPGQAIAQDGQQLFQQNCQTCHTVGGGQMVGPDLANVNDRRDQEWLINFIQSSQSMIQDGDEQAEAIFNEFNNMVMPDQNLSDQEVIAILDYIASESGGEEAQTSADETTEDTTGEATASASEPQQEPDIPPVDSATEQDVNDGKLIFTGQKRLTNKGPSCISCHEVKNDNIISGGNLARELTNSFDNAGGDQGVTAILKNPPFPVMNEAYKNKNLTASEIFKLKAFLKHTQEEQYYQIPRDYRARMLGYGIVGIAVLLGLFGMLWSNRRKKSVNQEIIDRQIKSETSW